jgi:hypothetical protein
LLLANLDLHAGVGGDQLGHIGFDHRVDVERAERQAEFYQLGNDPVRT